MAPKARTDNLDNLSSSRPFRPKNGAASEESRRVRRPGAGRPRLREVDRDLLTAKKFTDILVIDGSGLHEVRHRLRKLDTSGCAREGAIGSNE
jgi:hypothetical protein